MLKSLKPNAACITGIGEFPKDSGKVELHKPQGWKIPVCLLCNPRGKMALDIPFRPVYNINVWCSCLKIECLIVFNY